MGTTASQKKLFFNLRKIKGQLQAFEEGDLKPEHVKEISTRLNVPEADVISMNRRLGGDSSLNAPMRADGDGGTEWMDRVEDENATNQESALAESEELVQRRAFLESAMGELNDREKRIFVARRLSDCLLYTSPSPRDLSTSRMPSSA